MSSASEAKHVGLVEMAVGCWLSGRRHLSQHGIRAGVLIGAGFGRHRVGWSLCCHRASNCGGRSVWELAKSRIEIRRVVCQPPETTQTTLIVVVMVILVATLDNR